MFDEKGMVLVWLSSLREEVQAAFYALIYIWVEAHLTLWANLIFLFSKCSVVVLITIEFRKTKSATEIS